MATMNTAGAWHRVIREAFPADSVVYGSAATTFQAVEGRSIQDIDILIRPAAAMKVLQFAAKLNIPQQWLAAGCALRLPDGIIELRFAYDGTTDQELIWLANAQPGGELTLDQLYTVKMSHRYLKNSPHFQKTRRDILTMRAAGAKIFDKAFLKRREAETYTYAHPSLEREKAEFFSGDGVKYVYDHDSIHQAVAIGRRPAYLEYAEPGREVKSSKARFDAAPFHVRLNGVIEEAMVLAIERSLVPFPEHNRSPERICKTFQFALEKVCTSITSGWFREFAWENYDLVLQEAKPIWLFSRFEDGLQAGVVKPYTGSAY